MNCQVLTEAWLTLLSHAVIMVTGPAAPSLRKTIAETIARPPDGDVTDAKIPLWHQRLWKPTRVMLGSFSHNQCEQTPEICLMLSLHFVQSL